MKYRVTQLSYINDTLLEPGAIVDIPENVLAPGNHGDNLEPVKGESKKGKDDAEVSS